MSIPDGFSVLEQRSLTLVSSNAVDETYPMYDNALAVAVEDLRIFNNIIYSVLEAMGTNANEVPGTSAKWYEEQAVNSKCMMDGQSTARTKVIGDLDVIISFGKCNTLAIMGAKGSTLTVRELDLADATHQTVLKETTYIITDVEDPSNWFDFFLQDIPAESVGNIIHPLTLDYEQKVQIFIDGAETEIAFVAAGRLKTFGCTQWGASAPIINPRPPIKNAFGNVTLVKGDYAIKIDADITFATKVFDAVSKELRKIRNTPTLYLVYGDKFETFQQFGYYTAFIPVLSNAARSRCSISIESFLQGDK